MAIKVRQGGAWVTVAEKNAASITYSLPLTGSTGASGTATWTLTPSNSGGTSHAVTLEAGDNINIQTLSESTDTFKISANNDNDNTTYDLIGGGTDGSTFGGATAGTGKVILVPSTGTNDEVSITAGSNVKIDNTGTGGFTISAASGSGGSSTFLGLTDTPGAYTGQAGKLVKVNSTPDALEFADETTYSLPLTGATGASGIGEATWTLTPSSGGTTDPVKIKAGANINIDATNVASGEFTISASSGTATISDGDYGDITVSSTGTLWRIDNNVIEAKHINAGGTAADDKILVYDSTQATKWKWTDQIGTTYSQQAGASGNNVELKLKNNNTGVFDNILLTKGSGITFSSVTTEGFTISADSQEGTTYTLPTFGTTNAASGIKLTPDGGAASATQTINITGTNGITVVGNSSNNTLTIDGQNAGSNTTYSQEAGADGDNVELKLKNNNAGTFDDILITKGSGITFSSVTSEGFTISADTQDGTTYTLPTFGSANGSSGIKLTPDGGTASASQTVNINGTNGITVIGSGTDTLTIDGQNAGSNTTYELPLTGTSSSPTGSTGNGEAIWTLTDNASPANEDPVKIKAGTNISISVDSANSEFTISASSGTATIADGTYGDIEVQSSGSDWQIRADTVGITELSATGTDITTKFLRGDNTWAPPTSVTYDLVTENGPTTNSEKIRLTDGGSDIHDVILAVTGNLTISRNASLNSITIDGSGAGSNTTYQLKATKESDGGNAGTGSDPYLFLDASSGTDDSVQLAGTNGVSVTWSNEGRIIIDGSNTTGTTYALQGGGTDPTSNFGTGTGSINLLTGGAIQNTVTITAGANIKIKRTGNNANFSSGFTIDAAEVGSDAFRFKNTGTGSGTGSSNKAVFQLYTASNTSGNANQRITITPGSGIKFTNQGAQALTIEGEAQAAGTIDVSNPSNQSGPLLFVTSTGNDKTVYGDTALTWNAGTDTLNIGSLPRQVYPNNNQKVAINSDVSTHIYPSANESFDIGKDAQMRWRKIYAKEIDAQYIGGKIVISTNDQEVLFTEDDGTEKVVAGSSKFKFDGNQLEISNAGSTNFIHLNQDAGLEICRSTYVGTGSPGGAYIDFKDNPNFEDYDCRIQQITPTGGTYSGSTTTGYNAQGKLSGGLLFYTNYQDPRIVITDEGVLGVGGRADVMTSRAGFCPGYPSTLSVPNNWQSSIPYVLDVNGKAFFRREDNGAGVEGGQITLEGFFAGSVNPGWTFDVYSAGYASGGRNDGSVDRQRFRILSENTKVNNYRADQLFCMNRDGAIAFAGNQWPNYDDHGNEDYGAEGAVLLSQGSKKPPIWSLTGGNGSGAATSPIFSSPLRVARDNASGEGGGIILAKSNSSTFSHGWEIDSNGTSNTPDYRVIDCEAAQVRFAIKGGTGTAGGAIAVKQMGNWGQDGQVIMSRGSTASADYSHRPISGAWWNTSKPTVPVIHTDGVMEIGKYLDFHATQTVSNNYSARMENNASWPEAIQVRNYIQSYSDSRIKDNLVVIGSPLDKVGIITGYTYNYTNTDEESPSRTGGVIAQDVEKVLPELIQESSDGFKTLNYNGIAALLVEAVKELKAKNTALEARIAALESS